MPSSMSTATVALAPERTPNVPWKRARWWLIAFAIWTAFPILTSLQAAVYAAYTGQAFDWLEGMPLRFADWYACALFTPLCFWLVRRYPMSRETWLRNGAMQLLLIVPMSLAKFVLYASANELLGGSEPPLGRMIARSFVYETYALWALLGVVHAIEYHRRAQEREIHAARLETELTSARLDALTAQLQPHFLFNTLNSISTLMRRDVQAADEMLAHLGELLHCTLRERERHVIPLSEELELLRHYLDIMKIRFHDRLDVRMQIAPDCGAVNVPPLLLQPLVENAIRHGISRKPGAGLLEISASREGEMLRITVRDDGEGAGAGAEGVGLSNTRRRLRELYGDEQLLALSRAADGGTISTVRIPCAR
jgi:two-component system, LytTR family, sensor kinase